MAYDRNDLIITTHVRERFLQRSSKRYSHLDDCNAKNCIRCDELNDEIKKIASNNRWKLNQEIRDRLCEAEENRTCLNNTGFMGWYYEKYGYDKSFQFLIEKDLCFVVVVDNGKKLVVTCVSSKTHLAGKNQNGKHKFNHIKRKEVKALENSTQCNS